MKVINMLNQILGTSYLDEQEAVQDLIREDFIEKFTHEEMYYTDIVTRVFADEYKTYNKNLINMVEEFYNNLPNTELGVRVKRKLITNELSKNSLDIIILIKSFNKLDYHLNTEKLNLGNVNATIKHLNDISNTLENYLVNYMLSDKAFLLIHKLSNNIKYRDTTKDLTIDLGNKNMVYLMITSLLKPFSADTLNNKTISGTFYTNLISNIYSKETKDTIDNILKDNALANNLEFKDGVVYTSEFIDELNNKIKTIKDNYLTIPRQEVKTRNDFANKTTQDVYNYFIVALDTEDLYTITRVSILIRILGLKCKPSKIGLFN